MISEVNRRKFLSFLGSAGLLTAGTKVSAKPKPTKSSNGSDLGSALLTSDRIELASGYSYYFVAKSGESINQRGDKFGVNNDFTCFLPKPGVGPNDGYLLVNHEFPDPQFTSEGLAADKKSAAHIEQERASVGCSMMRFRKDKKSDRWQIDVTDPLNRRLDANTPIPYSQVGFRSSEVPVGTFANCSGGFTSWGTFLTCEENYEDYMGEKAKYGWERFYKLNPDHYGWVVEIDPVKQTQKKLVGLGRFSHEGALFVEAKDGTPVVYMGDDAEGQCVYKFISADKNSLDRGTLYVADLTGKRWLPLEHSHPKLKKAFKTKEDMMTSTRQAAKLVGGSPLDRPEGIARNPKNGSIVVSLTNNIPQKNFYGSLLSIEEKDGDYKALTFNHKTILAGGVETGFACPDNLCFDSKGGLWIVTDISGKLLNKDAYLEFGNNGLFYVPPSGPNAGRAVKIASAPVEAEFTGPCLLPDGETLLLSVQHPGEYSPSMQQLSSHWPDGGKSLPRSSLIAITGPGIRI